jgi:hypothetical protein
MHVREIPGVGSAIDVFSVSDTDDEYTESHIVKLADDAVITHSISPKIAQRPSERFPETPWIFQRSNALVHVVENAPG